MWSRIKQLWSRSQSQLEDLATRYGKLVFIVWFAIFFATLGGFATLISMGFQFEGTAGAATLVGAYAATRATFPVRVVATLALVPIVDRVWRRLRGLDAIDSDVQRDATTPSEPSDEVEAHSG